MKTAWMMAVMAVAVACGPSHTEPVDGGAELWIMSGGRRRTYTLHLPPTYRDDVAAPLLMVFHGAGDNGAAFEARIGLDAVTDQTGVVTVFPDGVEQSWAARCDCTDADLDGVDDIEFTSALIAHLSDTISIDPQRIYVAGFSQGAMLVHLLACELADRLAGAASVGATMLQSTVDNCQPAVSLPVVFFQGTNDATFPWGGVEFGVPKLLSIDASVSEWVRHNGCNSFPERETLPDLTDDGTVVRTERFTGCAPGGAVLFYAVEGGGHTWPGGPGPWPVSTGIVSREIDAGEEMLHFFGAYPTPPR